MSLILFIFRDEPRIGMLINETISTKLFIVFIYILFKLAKVDEENKTTYILIFWDKPEVYFSLKLRIDNHNDENFS